MSKKESKRSPTYKMIELVGTSKNSYEDAVNNAIADAAESLDGLDWFQVTEWRGAIKDAKVSEFQAVLKVGFAFSASFLIFALVCAVNGEAGAKKAPLVTDSVWVKKLDGGIACNDPKDAVPVEAGAQALEKAGVKVLESRKQNDGKMRAAVCGIPTGNENAYSISKADLAKAKSLGFEETESSDSPLKKDH